MPNEHQFSDLLASAIDKVGSPVCVGIDPVASKLPREFRGLPPAEGAGRFSERVLDLVAGVVPSVKVQSACFERFGWAGVAAMERVVAKARSLGFVVVLDAKRGDIGSTSEHYAAAAAAAGAHAITVNGYLGRSGIEPFLGAGLGVFVLVRTSNPDSDALQGAKLVDGRTVSELLAAHVEDLGESHVGTRGLSNVGAVVGATKSSEGEALRAIMQDQIFLVPGYGAQGGTAEDIHPLLRPDRTSPGTSGVLVNASRSVIFAGGERANWAEAVRAAAVAFAADVAAASVNSQ